MFDNLSDKLDKAFHILKGHGKITEVNVETLKEVRFYLTPMLILKLPKILPLK
jgi:signal recognition particle GTPase